MMFIKTTIYSAVFNFLFIGIAVTYYFIIPQPYSTYTKSFSQLYYRCTSCNIAEQNAIDDFKNKNYQVVFWGLDNLANNDRFSSKLLDKYKIKAISGGCMRLTEMDCYSIKMHQLLFKKYGEDVLYNTYKEIDTMIN